MTILIKSGDTLPILKELKEVFIKAEGLDKPIMCSRCLSIYTLDDDDYNNIKISKGSGYEYWGQLNTICPKCGSSRRWWNYHVYVYEDEKQSKTSKKVRTRKPFSTIIKEFFIK